MHIDLTGSSTSSTPHYLTISNADTSLTSPAILKKCHRDEIESIQLDVLKVIFNKYLKLLNRFFKKMQLDLLAGKEERRAKKRCNEQIDVAEER